ncbi:PH domain-containing protein [Anoxybacteroides amylolyticum]|uniref:Bacterial PH domain protein n=1 Tax=Anoxybacteroides amylolyticum TaxID=294699 RepID=A0A160F4L0_9BACL|nr:PH domain-containing protein [Anoxybacillus amylolyticus]ANB61389.1 bacterial PH domain protein [Anoxybacillus amylolyticus]
MVQLSKRISERAVSVWRIHAFLRLVIFLLGYSIVSFFIWRFDGPKWVVLLLAVLFLIHLFLSVVVWPLWRWQRWRYDVREKEMEVEYGVWTRRRTLIPMSRVQHVDFRQGPLLKKYRLASVVIFTAATVHEIPALDEQEAEKLCHVISAFVKVDDRDV